MDQMKIGRFIAELRKERNMTQRVLAEKLGITDRAISKWENGRGLPDVSLLKPLCEILGISVTELLNGERSEEVTVTKTEETVYEILSDRETQIKNTQRVKRKFSAFRSVTIILIIITGVLFSFMVLSGLRGEGYSVSSALETQKARIASKLIENEKYESAVFFMGFGRTQVNAAENWIAGMRAMGEEFRIEDIDISPIMLDDYFPMGKYTMKVYDYKENIYHIYEGLVTYQNGGTAFMSADIPDKSADVRRGIIGYMLNTVFATYNPG